MRYGVAKHHVCVDDGTVFTPGEVLPEAALTAMGEEKLNRLVKMGAMKLAEQTDAPLEEKTVPGNTEETDAAQPDGDAVEDMEDETETLEDAGIDEEPVKPKTASKRKRGEA